MSVWLGYELNKKKDPKCKHYNIEIRSESSFKPHIKYKFCRDCDQLLPDNFCPPKHLK